MGDNSVEVRYAACYSVAMVAEKDNEVAIAALEARLVDNDAVRYAAVEGLRIMAEKEDAGTGTRMRIMSAIETLLLVEGTWGIRNWAVHVLEVLRGGVGAGRH
eukprot:NODE_3143_length_824_cov_257.992198.p3 GENE.NODE_3143_length_824_cov_257.992198~~NODE_3143_length_824_cov_257.992198.p3  ORF type:complete len:103 (+),score=23.24 NODE_3143_length_824_cov_257.992198:3-311(+)